MSAHAHDHHASPKPYVFTLAALLVLTGITVGAAYVNFGSPTINIIIALAIATVKASLVALIFMHLRHDNPLNAVIFVSSLIFLGIFLISLLVDVGSRDKIYPNGLRMTTQQPAPDGQGAPGGIPGTTPNPDPNNHVPAAGGPEQHPQQPKH